MKRPTLPVSLSRVAVMAVGLALSAGPLARAQDQAPPPQGTSRGENFSAKPPAALFASDCTGSGCHKGPQGLGNKVGVGGLAGFLREHYTNSRESASALANYLSKIPSGPEPKEARTPRGSKPATAAAPASSGPAGWFERPAASDNKPAATEAKPSPNEARKPPAGQNAGHTPPTRASRTSVKPQDDPAAAPATSATRHPVAEPAEPAAKPDESSAKPDDAAKPGESPAERPAMSPARPNPRAQRGRQPAATAAAPSPPPVPEVAPAAPPPPPPPPAPKEYDIFD